MACALRSAGVTFEQMQKAGDGKAEYFVARIEKKGESLDAHLADIIVQALKKLPIQKVMRWGDSEHQFVRPVHGLIVLRRSGVAAVRKETTDLTNFADWPLTLLIAQRGGVLYLPIVGRHWRQHPQQSHRTGDPEAVRRIRHASNLWR